MKKIVLFGILLLMFTALGTLGTWQVMRYFEKVNAPGFQPITLSGQFLNDETRFWVGRSHQGVTGVYVLTPFLDESNQAILINRGWAGGMDVKPAENQTVHGLKIPLPRKSAFTPEKPYDGKKWFFLDPPAILAQAGLQSTENFYVVLNHKTPGVIPVDKVIKPHNPHLGYATTWFSFMIILAVITFLFLRPKKSCQKTS